LQEKIEEFINYLAVEKGLAKNTLLAYDRDLTQYYSYLSKRGITSWQETEQNNILVFLMYLQGQGQTSNSISRKLVLIPASSSTDASPT